MSIRSSLLAVALAALSACGSRGVGTGALENTSASGGENAVVRFAWESDGSSPSRGEIAALVPGHGEFRGRYMQITSDTRVVDVDPWFADYWHRGWSSWDGWAPGRYGDAFVTTYSGRVIAVLSSPTGERMRCRFFLAEPSAGPAAGGMGECELSSGARIADVVLEGR